MYLLDLFTLIASAVFYYQVGEAEYSGGWILASVSVLMSVLTSFILHWDWRGMVFGQFLIFAGLTAWNALTGRNRLR